MISFHKDFKKKYKKLPVSLRSRCDERLILFQGSPFDPLLRNHPLHGAYDGYRSINITGNIRAIYRSIEKDHVEFADIGTHHELFGN